MSSQSGRKEAGALRSYSELALGLLVLTGSTAQVLLRPRLRTDACPVPGGAAGVITSATTDSYPAMTDSCAGTRRPIGVLPGGMADWLDLQPRPRHNSENGVAEPGPANSGRTLLWRLSWNHHLWSTLCTKLGGKHTPEPGMGAPGTWCPRYVCTQRKDHVRTKEDGSRLQAKEKGLRRNQPC